MQNTLQNHLHRFTYCLNFPYLHTLTDLELQQLCQTSSEKLYHWWTNCSMSLKHKLYDTWVISEAGDEVFSMKGSLIAKYHHHYIIASGWINFTSVSLFFSSWAQSECGAWCHSDWTFDDSALTYIAGICSAQGPDKKFIQCGSISFRPSEHIEEKIWEMNDYDLFSQSQILYHMVKRF